MFVVRGVCRLGLHRVSAPRCTIRNITVPPNLLPFLEARCKGEPSDWKDQELHSMYGRLQGALQEIQDLELLAKEESGEMRSLAEQEVEELQEGVGELVAEIRDSLVPPEKYDGENAMVEVVPGAGGQEASIFAEEIFNLYLAYTESLGFKVEVRELTRNQAVSGATAGLVKGVLGVAGRQVFNVLKFESGVHRVQRVPLTAKSDKLHTSTCSVAVLPEPRDIQVNIALDAPFLKWQYMRASGAGGQGVNTADSAVRLTHTPTGVAVESQEQRSQIQNKKTALKKLHVILYQKEFSTDVSAISSDRKFQIGNMNRNEKIRTYNFSRHSVTDHRLGVSQTVARLGDWIHGRCGFEVLDTFGNQLREDEKEERLLKLISSSQSSVDNKKSV